jgi:hypothetical protein
LKPAAITSIKVALAPFTFQQVSPGEWAAVGSDGNPPSLVIRVYGTF